MEFLCQDYTLQYSYAIPFHVKLADSWLWMSNSTSCEFVLNRLVKIWPLRLLCVNVRALFPVSILQFWQIHGGENEDLVGYRTRERRKECLLEWVFCRQKLTFCWRKVAPVVKKNNKYLKKVISVSAKMKYFVKSTNRNFLSKIES